ncbi:FliH/SctL family protein [Alphaproteobacteria bacterium LSUCC0684]
MMTASAENQAHEDQVDAPLDRAEILRLVKASRNAGYNRSEEAFTQPKQDFKPLSIKEMAALSAMVAREKAAAEATSSTEPSSAEDAAADHPLPEDKVSAAEENADQTAPETSREEAAETAIADPQAKAGDEAAADTEDDAPDESGNPPQDASSPESIETIGEQVNKAAETADESAPEDAGSFDEIKARMDAVSRLKPNEEGAAEHPEYQRGYEEGRKAVLAEKEAEMNDAIAAFTAATEALSKDENIDLSQLSPAISRAIMELASERAGIAIDAHPDAFAVRIETMVKRIRNRVDEPYIRLHPEDAKIIGETLGEMLSPRVIHIIADENLNRGDARIDVGSIGIMDLISSRMADETGAKESPGAADKGKVKSSGKDENQDTGKDEDTPPEAEEDAKHD